MHVALGDPAGRVAEKAGDGQLGKAEISGHASESVAKNVRCHVLELRFRADPVEDPHYTDEMPVAPVRRKHERRSLTPRSRPDAGNCRRPKHSDLCTTLRVRKANTMIALADPHPLESQRFHPPKPRQKHRSDRGKPGGMFTFGFHSAHNVT